MRYVLDVHTGAQASTSASIATGIIVLLLAVMVSAALIVMVVL